MLFGLVALAAIVVSLAVVFLGEEPGSEPEPEPGPGDGPRASASLGKASQTDVGVAAEARPGGVQITVEGVPDGARIYYNNSMVPMNPFRVERKKTLVELRVEADQQKTFRYSVLPTEDRVVEAVLEALNPDAGAAVPDEEGAQVGETGEREATTKKKDTKKKNRAASPTKPRKTKHRKSGRKRFQEGGRGTRFGEDFE